MRPTREILTWAVTGALGVAVLWWAFPRAFPFYPERWELSRAEAVDLALERLQVLGEPVRGGYVVPDLRTNEILERRLLTEARSMGPAPVRATALADRVLEWVVYVYAPGAATREWSYRAHLSLTGEVLALVRRVAAEEALPPIVPVEARRRADALLRREGYDLAGFEEPEVRSRELANRTDLTLRYRALDPVLGLRVTHGLEVTFTGDRLAGFVTWIDDPLRGALQQPLQLTQLVQAMRILVPFLLVPFVAVPFLRRYHAGEVGARRGVQIFLLVLGTATILIALTGRSASEAFAFGPLTRRQMTWVWGAQMVVMYFTAVALVTGLSWSVGECLCRERWGRKLAAFDALLQGSWGNATVARSALRGVVAGIVLAAGLVGAAVFLPAIGGWTEVSFLFGPWWQESAWPGLALLLVALIYGLHTELFARLLLVPPAVRRYGRWIGGGVVALLGAVLFFPYLVVLPVSRAIPVWVFGAAAMVALFLATDLLSTLLASVTTTAVLGALPLLFAGDNSLRLQGWLPLVAVAVPLLVSLPYLGRGREFAYRWEDVPAHVRRISERERQRVELETARRIQGSILPELPSRLGGVELAHAYRPATEVGGDFYDVLPLADGRLAVALGDVAGHGVSSGLVMARAHSALVVQAGFDPEVEPLFATLNRLVYQSSNRRLLATLCYLLLDPGGRRLVCASAGHTFPYRVAAGAPPRALESVAYPLGVRPELEVHPVAGELGPGDCLFLYSDGLVEARPEGSEEPFGFARLEAALERRAGRGPGALCDGVLEEVERYVGRGPQEDDITVLVLALS